MPSKHTTTNLAIATRDLQIGYENDVIATDLQIEIEAGTLAAVLGPNGSGKSTLMHTLMGLLPALGGTVLLNGRAPKESYGRIGYVPQRFSVDPNVPMSVFEFLNMARTNHIPVTRIDEKLGEVGLNPVVVKRMPLAHLSGGQMQRVLLARAILCDPEILFLDEPAAGVDAGGEMAFFSLLQHQKVDHNTTILMISHEINLVEQHVDTVLCLNRELICQGPPKSAMTQDVVAKLYGDHVHRHEH